MFTPGSALAGLDRRTAGRASAWAAQSLGDHGDVAELLAELPAATVLVVTDGDVIDYAAIKTAFRADAERFDLREIAFDRWGATQMSSELVEEGFPLMQTGQGFASMSGPTKEFLRLVTAGLYRHGGHPLIRWQADNLIVRTDPAGNLKPDKARSADKIDSIVGGIMALDRALRHDRTPEDDYLAAGF